MRRDAPPGWGLLGVCRVRVFGLSVMSRIVHGDAFDVLADMGAESVHAIVTDPPYGLAFMGRDWDTFDSKEYQEWCEEWAALALGVLKPGGHLLAFSGNRTHHRLFSGVEDAGFEIRDTLTWHYGSGFPKALDVSKAIDKAAGAEREVVDAHPNPLGSDGNTYGTYRNGEPVNITTPATDAAREWDGWKTALKPATEFVVLARKPFSGTVAENVQAHGTGALNIGETRLEPGDGGDRDGEASAERRYTEDGGTNFAPKPGPRGGSAEGRYPANVIFNAEAAEALDREVGELPGPASNSHNPGTEGKNVYGTYGATEKTPGRNDTGGPSRYFYTSKATRAERTLDGRIDNAHPTVKPVDLMEWLVRLVTAEGQVVLDPFAGTGTTCRAAKNLGREFIGIEQQAKWADVARVRCGLTPDDPSNVRGDDAQRGIGAFAP